MKNRSVTLGFKYRIYPNEIQKELLNHQMFISNQAYNICVNLKQKEWEANKDLEKNKRKYLKAIELDSIVKKQSSKTCNKCGFVKRDLTLKDRVFECSECGYSEHRDINASKNILKRSRVF
ncbi:transposase [Thiovulum sp. ES]|nr:transposase [Thiovulum sp. ES]